jgi:hypothetical protein
MRFSVPARIAGVLLGLIWASASFSAIPAGYTGHPFRNQTQQIPGIFYPWRYDSAGVSGVTWFYPDTRNQGTYHNKKTNGVEDYTGLKMLDPGWDHMVTGTSTAKDTMIHYTDSNNVYLGYVLNGEWQKTTVNVKDSGVYSIDAMVTACCKPDSGTECTNPVCNPRIRITFFEGADSTSTDTVLFLRSGYYHTYKYESNLTHISLKQGLQVLRLKIVGQPPYNVWYLKFSPITTPIYNKAIALQSDNGLAIRKIGIASGNVRLDFISAGSLPVHIDCFDGQGKLVVSQAVSPAGKGINHATVSGHIASGMHFFRLTQGKSCVTSRVFLSN